MDMQKILEGLFYEKFESAPDCVAKAPGRINIIGEHTDYNQGWVLPSAIDKSAWLAVSITDDEMVELYAADLDENVSIAVADIHPFAAGSWPNYLLGVLAQFKKRGIRLPGFRAVLSSQVPVGAGLSSSAAIEAAMAVAVDHLLNCGLDRLELVHMAQKAEHEYAGVLCGIMDQFASVMGRADHAIQLDCASLQFEYLPLNMEGYKWLLLNSNVSHALASSEYNTRRQECQRGVDMINSRYPQVVSLRDVSLNMLDECVRPVDELIDRRCRYVVQENARLLAASKDLQAGDLVSLGKKMLETHTGLSRMYEVSCRELDWLVDYAKAQPGVLGARLMGGGFGGCTINLIKESEIESLVSTIKPAYEQAMQRPLTTYIASAADGARVIY
jgi:galactokinase